MTALGIALLGLFGLALAVLVPFVSSRSVRSLAAALDRQLHWVFVGIASSFGIGMVFITPPLQVPDEQVHFYRIYLISEGDLLGRTEAVPRSILALESRFYRLKWKPAAKTTRREIVSQRAVPLDPLVTGAPNFVTSATLPFLPAAVGVAIARRLGLSPLHILYAARLTNLLSSVFLIAIALRISRGGKWVLFMLALMPMTLFMLASCSYDAMTIALAFLLVASFLKACGPGEALSRRDLLLFFGAALALALCKPPYFLLGALFFLIPPRRLGSPRRFAVIGLTLAVSVLLVSQISSFWQLLGQTTRQIANAGAPAGTDPGRQMLFVLGDVPFYLGVLGRSLWHGTRAYYHLESFIGRLGWLDVRLPAYLIHAYGLALVGAAVAIPTGDLGLTRWRRLLLLALVVAGVVLIMTAMYLGWTPVGGRLIGGIQGRYFIPFAPLLLLAVSGSAAARNLESGLARAGLGGFHALFVPCFFALAMIPTLHALIARYYRG